MSASAGATAQDRDEDLQPRARSLLLDLRRAARVAPQLASGLWLTALLAVVGTGGHLLVPLTVQRLVDRALAETDVAAVDDVLLLGAIAVGLAIVAGFASWQAMFRLVRAAAAGLAELRTAAFRQIHRLSVVEVDGDRRGSRG
jgi:ATP-binding cassette subfamily B protein